MSRGEETLLEEPIFVFGLGRSGTTVVHRMLSEHPEVAWLSALTRRFPGKPSLNRAFMLALDLPLIGPSLRRVIKTSETYELWERHCRGFSTPNRDLTEQDLTDRSRTRIRRVLAEMLTPGRRRLLVKYTGWPRLGLMRACFPDGRFIHVLRDGRAVANSRLDIAFWDGYSGPDSWGRGPLPSRYRREWEQHDRSFVAMAAIEWKMTMDAYEQARTTIPASQLLEIKYEELCANTMETLKRMTDFAHLSWTRGFERSLSRYAVINSNDKWRQDLTKRQQEVLQLVLGEHLAKYGYDRDDPFVRKTAE